MPTLFDILEARRTIRPKHASTQFPISNSHSHSYLLCPRFRPTRMGHCSNVQRLISESSKKVEGPCVSSLFSQPSTCLPFFSFAACPPFLCILRVFPLYLREIPSVQLAHLTLPKAHCSLFKEPLWRSLEMHECVLRQSIKNVGRHYSGGHTVPCDANQALHIAG